MYQILRDALNYVKKQCVDVRFNLFITLNERKAESLSSVPPILAAEAQGQYYQRREGFLFLRHFLSLKCYDPSLDPSLE